MPNITERRKWEIANALSEFLDGDNWEPFAAAANLDLKKVEKKDSAKLMAQSLVVEAIKQEKLPALLKEVIVQYPNKDLQDMLSELLIGYMGKLDKLARIIKTGQCILFLGPGILKVKDDKRGLITFNEALMEKIINELDNDSIYYDAGQRENLTYLVQRYYKKQNSLAGEAGTVASKLFDELMLNGQIDESVFDKLVKLPWKLIININPDNILAKKMNERIKDSCLERKYNYANNKEDKIMDAKVSEDVEMMKEINKSFFYNLIGTFEEPQDILYTESDFLEFITSVEASRPPMHSYINKMFANPNKYYLFLGFDFDQWYFKIFIRALKLHETEERAISLNTGLRKLSECNLDFFEQKFKFYFVNDNVDKFMSSLLKSYEGL